MSFTDDTTPGDEILVLGGLELSSAELGGHTIDELADYYDAGLRPPDASIDESAGCQIALAAIARLRALTTQLADDDQASQSGVDEGWVSGILNQISVQARAGRDIPLDAPGVDSPGDDLTGSDLAGTDLTGGDLASRATGKVDVRAGAASADLVITEGAVRGIVRAAGDRVAGLFIGRCRFVGDVTVAGEPIVIEVDASVLWGHAIRQTAEAARQQILADVKRHTRLNIVAVDVTVHDVQLATPDAPALDEGNDDD